ncbi:hypothetical protein DFQ28_000047 [Apophysomyces sp. BC1034]|nr:hypothetical protein DFQ30_007797 [Apophysomyces sp. BC1015]KAG0182843.1 hypothetical protein DFQ29_001783 [Apophysomyces sp. BC1021]KAG0194948.1 hypothetical protein DFQ28_000047 [Apophysomyces sp. BC1034]
MPTAELPTLTDISIYPIKSCHSIKLKECAVDALGLVHDRRYMFIDELTNRFVTQRKYASMTLVRPVINADQKTMTLTAEGQTSLTLPLDPAISELKKRDVQLWKDQLSVYDMGDEAAQWFRTFLANHRQHDLENNHNPEDAVEDTVEVPNVRMVILENPKKGLYKRPAHPKLPGTHSPFSDWSPISFGFQSSMDEVNKGLVEHDISHGITIPIDRFRNNLTISGTIPWEEDEWLVAKIGEVTFYVIRPIARCTVPSINQDTGKKDPWGKAGVLDYLKLKRRFVETPSDGSFCVDVVPLTTGTIRVGDTVEVLERIPAEHVSALMEN